MLNKRGLELSANMIVIMVLAVAMLVAGLQFSARFFDKANDMKTQIDSQTEAKIQNLLDSGQLVANPLNRKEVKTGDSVQYALAISNQLGDTGGTENDFQMTWSAPVSYPSTGCTNKITMSSASGTYDDSKGYVPHNPVPYTIKKNQKQNVILAFDVDKATTQCTFVYSFKVEYKDSNGAYQTYGNEVYKLYLKVV